ncbi:MAG: MBL fold metallo-hydrolase [Promethearchaeota archaeon]
MTSDKPRCTITLACNNYCDPLIKDKSDPILHYPQALMRKMVGEHGLGYYLDFENESLIFDMGGTLKTFLTNFPALEDDWSRVKSIVFSHGHHDHVGGLIPFLAMWAEKVGTSIRISMHPDALAPRYRILNESGLPKSFPIPFDNVEGLLKKRVITAHKSLNGKTITRLGGTLELSGESVTHFNDENITVRSTGQVPRDHEKSFHPEYYLIKTDGGGLIKDTYQDDQALFVEYKNKYTVVLLGCCHAGFKNTISRVQQLSQLPIKAIVGGFHLLSASMEEIREKHQLLEDLAEDLESRAGGEKLVIRPTHCSGESFYLYLKKEGSDLLNVARCPVGTQLVLH